MQLLNEALCDLPVSFSFDGTQAVNDEQKSKTLKELVLPVLVANGSFHYVLLNTIGNATRAIEKFKKEKERKILEKLLIQCFLLLKNILFSSTPGKNRGYLLMPMMTKKLTREHFLLGQQKETLALQNQLMGKMKEIDLNLIQIIASFIHYQHNSQLPILSTTILAHLCR